MLGNGDTVFIRPLTPDDRPALAEFHKRQSPESIYRRFFSPKPELSDKELLHFTDVDMVDRAALAVESHDEFIAWASVTRAWAWSGVRRLRSLMTRARSAASNGSAPFSAPP